MDLEHSTCCVQASRNANDLWLSFWVSHVEPKVPSAPSAAEHGLLSPVSQVHTSALMTLPAQAPVHLESVFRTNYFAMLTPSFQHITPVHSRFILRRSNSSWPPREVQSTHVHVTAQSPAEKVPVHVLAQRAQPAGPLAQSAQKLQVPHSALTPDVKFYLYILVSIAAANSVFTLVRCVPV